MIGGLALSNICNYLYLPLTTNSMPFPNYLCRTHIYFCAGTESI